MQSAVKHLVKKVTLELVYNVVDERTKELKDELRQFKQETNDEIKELKNELRQFKQETKEDFKTINGRIDQIHIRLDQIMQMLVDIRK